MRKVYGEDITIKELKKVSFGYDDSVGYDKMVDTIEVGGRVFTVNEEGDFYITFPVDWRNADFFADCAHRDEVISVYEFISNWWGLDEEDMEDFIFYFIE